MMPVKKIKIEVNDAEGNKITASFQGRIPREKVVRLLDLLELMGGVTNDQENHKDFTNLSKYEKLQLVLKRQFPIGFFSPQDAIIAYEDTLNEPIKASTASTYLTRLAKAGFLSKSGSRGNHQFKIKDISSIFESHKILS
jgi:hypothetical protein